jgi:hypothetical protein
MLKVTFAWMNNNDLKWVGRWDKKADLKRLRFENGNVIPDLEGYFVDNEESDEDDWYILYFFVISHKAFKIIIMQSYK